METTCNPILVHIDMKGGPPTPRYLVDLLPVLKSWGATGILIEWEDMFPWEGKVKVCGREGHYSRGDVELVLEVASALQLEVVPLIQTFGHLEFLLKHQQFAHLREVPDIPNSLRPVDQDKNQDQSEGLNIVLEMVRQIIQVHQPKRIHIGCDEVWCLGESAVTAAYLETRGLSVTDLFLNHLVSVARFANSLPPQPQVLCWDDMMRTASAGQLMPLKRLVTPVIWNYGSNLVFPAGMMDRYCSVFGSQRMWAGTAWRGATGSCIQATTIKHHVDNHVAWKQVSEIDGGYILTGWARYDHFATLCEMLPVGLPSLRCCLAVLTNQAWNDVVLAECSKELGLQDSIGMEPYRFLTDSSVNEALIEEPVFPGSKVYILILAYIRLNARYNAIYNSSARDTWMNPWQIKHGFLNPLQIRGSCAELQKLSTAFSSFADAFRQEAPDLIHQFTADEWIGTNIEPKLEAIETFLSQVKEKIAI